MVTRNARLVVAISVIVVSAVYALLVHYDKGLAETLSRGYAITLLTVLVVAQCWRRRS